MHIMWRWSSSGVPTRPISIVAYESLSEHGGRSWCMRRSERRSLSSSCLWSRSTATDDNFHQRIISASNITDYTRLSLVVLLSICMRNTYILSNCGDGRSWFNSILPYVVASLLLLPYSSFSPEPYRGCEHHFNHLCATPLRRNFKQL